MQQYCYIMSFTVMMKDMIENKYFCKTAKEKKKKKNRTNINKA